MKKILLILTSLFFSVLYAQDYVEKEKQIEVIETTEVDVRKASVGIQGGAVQYFGEFKSELGLDYGIVLTSHVSPKYNVNYNIHLGDMSYRSDSLDAILKTSYYGFNLMFKANLIEIFKDKDTYSKISPYVSLGGGFLVSSASHYPIKQFIDLYVPVSLGVDYNISQKMILSLNLNGRVLFSDEWDNSSKTSPNDILFNPSLSFKYVVGTKKKTKREIKYKTVSYQEKVKEKTDFKKYEERKIESFVEVVETDLIDSVVKKDIPNNDVLVSNKVENKITKPITRKTNKNKNYLFYSIQVGSYDDRNYNLEKRRGVKQDFEIYDKKNKVYKYCVGQYASEDEAKESLIPIKRIRSKAYVICIYKGKKISLRRAKSMLAKGNVSANVEVAREKYLK